MNYRMTPQTNKSARHFKNMRVSIEILSILAGIAFALDCPPPQKPIADQNGQIFCGFCPPNSICLDNQIPQCDKGFGVEDGIPGCTQCANGFFKVSIGNVVCSKCANGFTNNADFSGLFHL
jgi:hypothetical protein